MKSSKIQELVAAGIESPKEYRDSLKNDWKLPEKYMDKLSMHFIRETTPEELFNHAEDGILRIKGMPLELTWLSFPSKLRKADYLIVSVRACPILKRAFALVQELRGDGQYERLEY